MKKVRMVLGFILVMLVFIANFLTADVIYVDASNVDGDDDGLTWGTAYRYLRDAIGAASSGDELRVAAGTYYPDEGNGVSNNNRSESYNIPSGVALYGGYPAGGGARDYNTNISILSGEIQQDGNNSNNTDHITTFNGVNDQTILNGFTVSDGHSDSWSPENPFGGGGAYIYNTSKPQITHCIFTDNSGGDLGGAIFAKSNSAPKITCCLFKNNDSGGGGALAFHQCNGDVFAIQNCIFWNNTAGFGGGAVTNWYCTPRYANCTFYNNNCDNGGDDFYNYQNPTTIHIMNCILWGSNWPMKEDNHNSTLLYCDIESNQVTGTYGMHSDPLFQDADNGNFYLSNGSPCFNYGQKHGSPGSEYYYVPETDFDDRSRPLPSTDTKIDLGVYEQYTDATLPVTLTTFEVNYSKNQVVIEWTTQSETDNLGFNLYRSENEHGYSNCAYLSLNSMLIDGSGTTTEPTYYSFTDEYPVIEGHTYWYWLQSVSTTNELELFGPVSLEIPSAGQLPTMTILESNYPNPFNPETTISFNVKENEIGKLSIFNLKGEKILKQEFEAGDHQYRWNAEGFSSGIYLYKLSSPTTNITKKMILMK